MDVAAAELKMNRLLEWARDLPEDDDVEIIPELAGRHKIKLAQFHQDLAHKQRVKNLAWVVAYICDKNGILWAVEADWFAGDGGWSVEAYSVGSPRRRRVGRQVLSR